MACKGLLLSLWLSAELFLFSGTLRCITGLRVTVYDHEENGCLEKMAALWVVGLPVWFERIVSENGKFCVHSECDAHLRRRFLRAGKPQNGNV